MFSAYNLLPLGHSNVRFIQIHSQDSSVTTLRNQYQRPDQYRTSVLQVSALTLCNKKLHCYGRLVILKADLRGDKLANNNLSHVMAFLYLTNVNE
jgi:hypothetical protein